MLLSQFSKAYEAWNNPKTEEEKTLNENFLVANQGTAWQEGDRELRCLVIDFARLKDEPDVSLLLDALEDDDIIIVHAALGALAILAHKGRLTTSESIRSGLRGIMERDPESIAICYGILRRLKATGSP